MLTIAIAQINLTVGDCDGNAATMRAAIIRVRSRAFGSGRQLPIAAHYPTGDDA